MKTLREGIRLPMLDCDALERAAKKRTGSRVDSGGTSQMTQMQTPNQYESAARITTAEGMYVSSRGSQRYND